MGPVTSGGVHLVAGRDRGADIGAWAQAHGGRVGLDGVLGDLNRTAREVFGTGSAATWAFAWDDEDNDSKRWWPQGITSSADAGVASDEGYAGRRLLVTTSYSKTVDGTNKGCRITVVELGEQQPIRYRHVLLVAVGLDDAGRPGLRPVHAHAGGVVWRGSWLHVAATTKGVHTFHLDDVMAVPADVGLGHRYVLPLRSTWAARTASGVEPLRYSFLSLDRGGPLPGLLVGEYGHGRMTRRMVRYALDPGGQVLPDATGTALPTVLPDGPSRMQGVVSVEGRLHVVTSNGRRGKGSLWTGSPGDLTRHARVLPPGPEDITYWPSRDELWTVTEYPGNRLVLALDRKRFD